MSRFAVNRQAGPVAAGIIEPAALSGRIDRPAAR
jgi:hypothetical protein